MNTIILDSVARGLALAGGPIFAGSSGLSSRSGARLLAPQSSNDASGSSGRPRPGHIPRCRDPHESWLMGGECWGVEIKTNRHFNHLHSRWSLKIQLKSNQNRNQSRVLRLHPRTNIQILSSVDFNSSTVSVTRSRIPSHSLEIVRYDWTLNHVQWNKFRLPLNLWLISVSFPYFYTRSLDSSLLRFGILKRNNFTTMC